MWLVDTFLLIMLLVIGITIILLTRRYLRERRTLKQARRRMQAKIDKANEPLSEVRNARQCLLDDHEADWAGKLTGQAHGLYNDAMSKLSLMSFDHALATIILERANRHHHSIFPFTRGFSKGKRYLGEKDLYVDEFGDLLAEREITERPRDRFTPARLLEEHDYTWLSTRDAFITLRTRSLSARSLSAQLDVQIASVTAAIAAVVEAGISVDPYNTQYEAHLEQATDYRNLSKTDPIRAINNPPLLDAAIRSLNETLSRVLDTKRELSATEARIGQAESQVQGIRDTQVLWAPELALGTPVNYTLEEVNGNPDKSLAEARAKLEAARSALQAGELDVAAECNDNAVSAAGRAIACLEKVLTAKESVDSAMRSLPAALSDLQARIDDAAGEFAAMKLESVLEFYSKEEAPLHTARELYASHENRLGAIKEAYLGQRFIAAEALIQRLREDLNAAQDGLAAIGRKLKTLRTCREEFVVRFWETEEALESLERKLEADAFYVPPTAAATFALLRAQYAGNKQYLMAKQANWLPLAESAEAHLAFVRRFDDAIDTSKQAHRIAELAIAEAAVVIDEAQLAVEHKDTREWAPGELPNACSKLASLEERIKVPNSDWHGIFEETKEVKKQALAVLKRAGTDQQAAENARKAISDAERKISMSRNWSRYAVRPDVASADEHVRRAWKELEAQSYEEAVIVAQEAKKRANRAQSDAELRARRKKRKKSSSYGGYSGYGGFYGF